MRQTEYRRRRSGGELAGVDNVFLLGMLSGYFPTLNCVPVFNSPTCKTVNVTPTNINTAPKHGTKQRTRSRLERGVCWFENGHEFAELLQLFVTMTLQSRKKRSFISLFVLGMVLHHVLLYP